MLRSFTFVYEYTGENRGILVGTICAERGRMSSLDGNPEAMHTATNTTPSAAPRAIHLDRKPTEARNWTQNGMPEAEALVSQHMAELGKSLALHFRKRMTVALVVGGFGRGEGAVTQIQGAVSIHNDYDLVVILDQISRADREWKDEFEQSWSAQLGVHVEVALLHDNILDQPPRTLFWLDIAMGGARVIAGDQAALSRLPSIEPRDIPIEEAGRLLSNRAVGLALSNLGGVESNETVKARHVHKAVLACGDAVLLAAGEYVPSLKERAKRLSKMTLAPRVGFWLVRAYEEAVRFRNNTASWQPEKNFDSWYQEALRELGWRHLAFEAWRVDSPSERLGFAEWKGTLFGERPDSKIRSGALAAARAYWMGKSPALPFVGHPRERLARVAMTLAYAAFPNATLRERASSLLGLRGTTLSNEKIREKMLMLRDVGS